ncbi:Protease production enhancer protein [Thalassovita gelatinovora]|uniref:Protease production enhancer protein n=1 Tax=Thalassovita gelatinovora TaxID=53501 RepID=A0A0P1F3Y6_THAGE|nr:response regulator transcription factor [Thalassovita gelatinovora]QIZ79258.1 response regulator transcription factor [Thalassovita gelatinovora]CUH62454.1 Protease production enhancer protein [Thalassovita gelatinovora]SEQ04610.1 two component transcriptional regulator, LuxR family [Thalassovita gelatinovora]
MKRILIADDHDLVRETLADYIRNAGEFSVDQASNLDESLDLIQKNGTYDLVLLDYKMPGMTLPEGLLQTLETNADHPVAIISGTASPDVARRALATGAAGFLPKTIAPETLISAVRHLLGGGVYAPQQFLESDRNDGQNPNLTPREMDVLRGICEGKANKEIARDLDVQEVTIKLHVKTLSRKLQARNRTHAAMIARDIDLI